MGPLNSVDAWAQFGLAGLVVLALFAILFWIIKKATGHLDAITKAHRSERDALAKAHRDERNEWRASEERREDRLEMALRELTAKL